VEPSLEREMGGSHTGGEELFDDLLAGANLDCSGAGTKDWGLLLKVTDGICVANFRHDDTSGNDCLACGDQEEQFHPEERIQRVELGGVIGSCCYQVSGEDGSCLQGMTTGIDEKL